MHKYAHTDKSILSIRIAIATRLSHVAPPAPALVLTAARKEQRMGKRLLAHPPGSLWKTSPDWYYRNLGYYVIDHLSLSWPWSARVAQWTEHRSTDLARINTSSKSVLFRSSQTHMMEFMYFYKTLSPAFFVFLFDSVQVLTQHLTLVG